MAAGISGIKAGRAFVLIEALDKTGTVLTQVRNRLTTFAGEMSNIGRRMAMQSVAALFPVGMAVKHGSEYDDIMRKVEARSEGTAQQMANLREESVQLARAVGLLPIQLGKVQDMLAQKGFNREQISNMAKPIADLTRAGGGGVDLMKDAEQSASLVAGTLQAFKMDSSEAAHVADIMTVALNQSNYSLEELTTSLQYAAPAANMYKVSLEETLAVLAAMRDLNIDASIAGTAFRNMMGYMSQGKEQEDFNARLKEMTGNTVKFKDDMGNMQKPMALLVALMEATKDLGTAERSDLLTQLLETRATIPGSAVGSSVETLAKMMAKLQDVDGAAERTRKQMDAGIGGSFRKLAADVSVLAIRLEEALAPSLKTASEWLTNVATFLQGLDPGKISLVVSAIVGFGVAGVGIMLLGQAIGMVLPLFTALTAITSVLSVAFATFPIWGAIGGFILMFNAVDDLTEAQEKWYDELLGFGSTVDSTARGWGKSWTDTAKQIKDTWSDIFSSVSGSLASGDLEGATATMLAGLKVQWLEFRDYVVQLADDVKETWQMSKADTVATTQMADALQGFRDDSLKKPGAGLFGDLGLPSQEFIDALRATGKGNIEERHRPFAERKAAREAELQKARDELRDAKIAAGVAAYLAEEARDAASVDTPVTEFKEQLNKIQKDAANLIGVGGIQSPAIAPKANDAAEAGSMEAARQFQENKFNVFGKVMDEVANNTREAADALASIQGDTKHLRELAAV